MARRHPHSDAMKLAGDLYGRLLNRNADKGGFEYVLHSLQDGEKSVRQHALEMVSSHEFANRFVKGRDDHAVAALLNRILLGRELDRRQVELEAEHFRFVGFKSYVETLVESIDYQKTYGEDRVPGKGH